MPSFEILADIFTPLFVFDSPKGSSNTFKTQKNISQYFEKGFLSIDQHLKINNSLLIQILKKVMLILKLKFSTKCFKADFDEIIF